MRWGDIIKREILEYEKKIIKREIEEYEKRRRNYEIMMAQAQGALEVARMHSPSNEKEFNVAGFYREQLNIFSSIGIGGKTRHGVVVTEKLLRITANRLDQLVKGKTAANMHYIDKVVSKIKQDRVPRSIPRSFFYTPSQNTEFPLEHLSRYDKLQLDTAPTYVSNKHAYSECNDPQYIDKIMTAYRYIESIKGFEE